MCLTVVEFLLLNSGGGGGGGGGGCSMDGLLFSWPVSVDTSKWSATSCIMEQM
jgi:hypothetical protein